MNSLTTYHGDNRRLGWNNQETRLTPQNIASPNFREQWHQPLDGNVNGSPLVLDGVVYVVTDNNSAYALRAADGKILWENKNISPTVTAGQFWGDWKDDENKHGALSTPVIDAKNRTLYFCVPRAKGLTQNYLVFAIDLTSGNIKPGWPVVLKTENQKAVFTTGQLMQRGALTLEKGWVYIPFGGRGDTPPWRGWLVGINTKAPTAPQRSFCFSPDTDGAGVWSAGGVSITPQGEFIAVTGNGDYDLNAGGNNLGQTVVRLSPSLAFSKKPRDFYTPANYKFLDDQDEDLGGATALILPDFPNSSTPHLLFTGGKDGCAYLLNRDNLGGLGGELQKMRLFAFEKSTYHEGIRATCAYFDAGADGRLIFVPGDNPGDNGNKGLVALKLGTKSTGGPAQFTQIWNANLALMRPTSPVVSSDGSQNGIVWLIEPSDGEPKISSQLDAFDALTGKLIMHKPILGGRKFTSPTVIDGHVFVGAAGVYCFGGV
jgi:outer membrane protein assembly factor BamB